MDIVIGVMVSNVKTVCVVFDISLKFTTTNWIKRIWSKGGC